MRLPRRVLAVTTVLALTAGCAGGGGKGGGTAAEIRHVQDTVRRSIDAENRGDVQAFLATWTDDGLRSYDAGSRNDLESGRATIGGEQTEVRAFVDTTVKGAKAVATLDSQVEIGLYRLRFDLVRQRGRWLLDGFRFLGPTPPAPGATVVDVKAVDYGYDVDRSQLASGDFAVHFVNSGQEQHEISILTLPADVTTAEVVFALGRVNGRDFSGLPNGYGVLGHLAYAGPGEDARYSLAQPLLPGRYAFACFLPVGGVSESGSANQPDAETHVSRGMVADFTVG